MDPKQQIIVIFEFENEMPAAYLDKNTPVRAAFDDDITKSVSLIQYIYIFQVIHIDAVLIAIQCLHVTYKRHVITTIVLFKGYRKCREHVQ